MKHLKQFLSDARRHKGLALIIVLSMLALATIVILAFLSVADTEHKATITYSNSQSARRLADTAVNVVIAQIRSGSEQDTGFAGREMHATQPGAVRKYTEMGAFLAGYKLFSDANLIFRPAAGGAPTGTASNLQERKFVADSEPPAGWDAEANLSRYVDLNEPVVKGNVSANGTVEAGNVMTFFPIIDPRAGQDMDPEGGSDIPAEGFSYSRTTALKGNNDNDLGAKNVILPPSDAPDLSNLRLAMPVQWLYLLKDGTMGYLTNTEPLRFVSSMVPGATDANGDQLGVPSATNPIVGRIAFWTDDETCKININTASEPTFLGQPLYYHERDHRWADYSATRSEYQRFPGHPATVALSSVFYPNPFQDELRSLDNYGKTGTALARILSVKNRIYNLAPKIHTGGSEAGTKYFDTDDYNKSTANKANAVVMTAALNERLYASVDELIFSAESVGGKRTPNALDIGTGILFNKQTLERSSAFLTANSRASEVNMFGLPRIAMWPVHTDPDRRTGFDKLVEFCSTLNGHAYLFKRQKARDANTDIKIERNENLMTMLDKIVASQPFPGRSDLGGKGGTFKDKLGEDNARQVLVEMFDYIRSTNLYDGFLVPPDRSNWPTIAADWPLTYIKRDTIENSFLTYTPGVGRSPTTTTDANLGIAPINNPFSDRFWPGHGQVTPTAWRPKNSSKPYPYLGFGRSVSISEVGLQFICTGDGQPDMYSWRLPKREATGQPDPDDEEGTHKFKVPELTEAQLVDATNGTGTFDPANGGEGAIVSGGRTALRVKENLTQEVQIAHDFALGFNGRTASLINIADVHWRNQDEEKDQIKQRYYSNYPPLEDYIKGGLYGVTNLPFPPSHPNYPRYRERHPGYDWRNWNWTLEKDTPLKTNQKRIQAALHLEFFCAAVGYTDIHPEFTVVLNASGVNSIQVDGKAIFNTTADVVLKSSSPLFEPDGSPQNGGFAAFRKVSLGRRAGARGDMPEDAGYNTNASGNVHENSLNLDLISSFFTVEQDQDHKNLTFSSEEMTVTIYDSHDYQNREPIQRIKFNLGGGEVPTPDLVVAGSALVDFTDANGNHYVHPAVQAPRWWSFHRDGCLGRVDDQGNIISVENRAAASTRGRLFRWDGIQVNTETLAYTEDQKRQRVPGAKALIYGRDATYADVVNFAHQDVLDEPLKRIQYASGQFGKVDDNPAHAYNMPLHMGSDTVRALQPRHGDARLIAAKYNVASTDWQKHRFWDQPNEHIAHNFSSYGAGEPGFDYGKEGSSAGVETTLRILPPAVNASPAQTPDAPHDGKASVKARRYFDFDDTDPGGRVGPFINKADEGNFAVGSVKLSGWAQPKRWRFSYYRTNSISAVFAAGSGSYFSPNRMVSSPVMMGSLPSRVWTANGEGAWTNLLFRPHVSYLTAMGPTEPVHPGQVAPPDHYLLDLFWMPVVEPYAISEALSTAGKVNMNYQIMPFTHIRRATALHAVMKGEMFAAMPNAEYEVSRSVRVGFGPNGGTAPIFRDETSTSPAGTAGTVSYDDGSPRHWHRSIAIDRLKKTGVKEPKWWDVKVAADRVQATLRQFEERFNFGKGDTSSPFASAGRGGLFRTASQICEIHLIPSNVPKDQNNVSESLLSKYSDRNQAMGNFWGNHSATGDNTRERPYANLYAKLTTRSNTFRVHVRSQAISKATRSVAADVFDPAQDKVTSEFRGSFLLERYIDTRDTANPLPDYGDGSDPLAKEPLENFYRFRILESKRFAP